MGYPLSGVLLKTEKIGTVVFWQGFIRLELELELENGSLYRNIPECIFASNIQCISWWLSDLKPKLNKHTGACFIHSCSHVQRDLWWSVESNFQSLESVVPGKGREKGNCVSKVPGLI